MLGKRLQEFDLILHIQVFNRFCDFLNRAHVVTISLECGCLQVCIMTPRKCALHFYEVIPAGLLIFRQLKSLAMWMLFQSRAAKDAFSFFKSLEDFRGRGFS